MSLQAQQLSVDDLALGMYVSKLDRPWLETPFLFQGFRIDSRDVIEELRRYCKYVFIDVEQSDESVAEALRIGSAKTSVEKDKPSARPSPGPSTSFTERSQKKEDTDSLRVLKTELANVKQAYSETRQVVQRIFVKLGSGESIEASAAARALEPMVESVIRNDNAMSWLARMKQTQDYIHDHSVACSVWAMIFGKHLGLSKQDVLALSMGALFMDVGKTRIPTEILNKPEPLNANELAIVKNHVGCGVNIVSSIEGIDPRVVDTVRFHHERHDGSGYPLGLSNTHIPLFARIAGIIDSYDAMTTRRPYAEPRSTYDAMRELTSCSGKAFSQELVEQFIQALGVFPVGTLVDLNTGEVGVVIAQNRIRRLKPKIMLLANREKTLLDAFPIIDLQNQTLADGREEPLWIEKGLPPGAYGIDTHDLYL